MHDFVLVAHSNMYLTLTHSMGGLCMCVCIQVFNKCTTPEQMREARREIMKFGPGVLSMVDRILWATAEVGRKVGSHSAAVRKVMIQDVDRGQGSHKDEITFRNENFPFIQPSCLNVMQGGKVWPRLCWHSRNKH